MKNQHPNIILNSDSYKASHYLQYPRGTQYVSSYIESRGGAFEQTVFFGLQMFLEEYLCHPITRYDIDEAEELILAHGLPFNRAGWEYILNHRGGYLPVEIQAVAEGSVLPVQNALVQLVNTDPEVPWLTSYLETALLRAVWYPTTVATLSWQCRQVIARYIEASCDEETGLDFKLHDFGARGATCAEAAAIAGLSHLVNFQGTDTLGALVAARRYYQADMAGFSIPAAEHSTITSWGRDGEVQAYANMLQQFAGNGKVLAVVSDSYDLWHTIDNIWGGELKSAVESSGGTLVVRPDSGDPVNVVTTTIEKLMAVFGCAVNTKGYRELPDFVRVIQGDGISMETIEKILQALLQRGLSAENVVFGMGGELHQKVHRDTLNFAMKTSAAKVDGLWRDVYKDPVTDSGKRSKKGRLAVTQDVHGQVQTIRENTLRNRPNLLQTVYRNGELMMRYTLDSIRARARGM